MDAVAAIYDAIIDDEAYAALPERLAAFVGARSGTLQHFSPDHTVLDFRSSYFSREMSERYVEAGITRFDMWRPPASRLENRNRLLLMDEAVALDSYLRSPFYNDHFRWWGDDTAHAIAGRFDFDGGYASFGVHRGLGAPFQPADLARLQPLVPHLRRLLELRGKLAAAKTRVALAEAALDAELQAVLVLDASGRLLMANRRAEHLLANGDGLTLSRVGVRACRETDATLLAKAVASACARVGAQGGALSIPRRGGRPLRVLVSPIQVGSTTRALVVVDDPAREDPERAARLRGYYGLSAAEAQIAVALAQGLSPNEIATLRQVSLATVRSQIQHALAKTDSSGVPQLVERVASAPARLAGSDPPG